MLNLLLFITSCGVMVGFAWVFYFLGQSALTAWVSILSLMANLFVLKQITLFGFNATASDIFAIGGLIGLNLLQEKFGKAAAQKAIWASFTALAFFALMSVIHLHYAPSLYDNSQAAYSFLLSPTPRLIFASLSAFFIVQQFDTFAYGFFRRALPHFSFIWTSVLVMTISQTLDTFLFGFLGLYGLVGAFFEMMIVSLGIKLFALANTIPWSFVSKRLFIKSC